MRPKLTTNTNKNTHVSKQKVTESSRQGMRPKLITRTDHNIHMSKQEALVSSQEGIIPKLTTGEGTQLPKLHVHQITKQSSAKSELCLKSLQSKYKQKPSTSPGQELSVHLGPSLSLPFFTLKVYLICQ